MLNVRRLAGRLAAATLIGLAIVQPSAAAPEADFPSKPVRLVVTFAPGGGSDILARIPCPSGSANR